MKKETPKQLFFDKAIKKAKKSDMLYHIAAFHLNNVWLEYADKFHEGKSFKTIMCDFKIQMQIAAKRHALKIYKSKVSPMDRSDFGVRTIWSFVF